MISLETLFFDTLWFDIIWFGTLYTVWFDTVWFDTVWFDTVWFDNSNVVGSQATLIFEYVECNDGAWLNHLNPPVDIILAEKKRTAVQRSFRMLYWFCALYETI